MQHSNQATSRHTFQCVLRYGLAALILVELGILTTLALPAIERRMDAFGLVPRSQQLTELAVASPDTLDRRYVVGETKTVAFTVRNLEATAQTYKYVVTVSKESRRVTMRMDERSVRVAPGQTKTITATIALRDDMGERAYVGVELSNGHAVGYWLEQGRVL